MCTNHIRNFCIISHVDHGKSTLADRMLELTGTIAKRDMKEQILDQMELERERGITIKLQPVTMKFLHDKKEYNLNLIDTPGHIDFTYEVSRSLAAVEGAILLVDATQGIQAQTLSNLYLARGQNLTIVPVLNKIDLPNAEAEVHRDGLARLLNVNPKDVLLISAKTGEGVAKLIQAVINKIPPPKSDTEPSGKALIFDSFYDEYLGVIAYVRVMSGVFSDEDEIVFLSNKKITHIIEVGVLTPARHKRDSLKAGEIGYVVTGLKSLEAVGVGDTISLNRTPLPSPIAGWQPVKSMVFASIFTKRGEDFNLLRNAFSKLKLNDAALSWEIEQSQVLGYGIRAGFLGLLHLEIIQERILREHGLETIVTVPAVAYKITLTNDNELLVTSPSDWPVPSAIKEIREPWIKGEFICPEKYIGTVTQFLHERRGIYQTTQYLSYTEERWSKMAVLAYHLPLSVILVDFYDQLKSVSSGFASFNYELIDYREADVVRLDILIAEQIQEELSMIVYRDDAYRVGKKAVVRLKSLLPREQFAVKLQAAIGGKIIAAERLSPLRKDVTAKLYGGDVTRKRKLLSKQKKGKKKMAVLRKGKVTVPSDVYIKLLKN